MNEMLRRAMVVSYVSGQVKLCAVKAARSPSALDWLEAGTGESVRAPRPARRGRMIEREEYAVASTLGLC